MADGFDELASGDPSSGWYRLADGEWEAAGALFRSALARGESPEALEGLSWPAWWLDDAARDGVRGA